MYVNNFSPYNSTKTNMHGNNSHTARKNNPGDHGYLIVSQITSTLIKPLIALTHRPSNINSNNHFSKDRHVPKWILRVTFSVAPVS